MGQVIRKDASADDIIHDTRTAHENARARGGLWQSLADQALASVLTLHETATAEATAASAAAAPLIAARNEARRNANDLVGRVADHIWNAVGRPRNDANLALLFPNGIAYYVEGDLDTQPKRMLLLAKLLTSNLHPRLPSLQSTAAASEVTAAAEALAQAIEAATGAALHDELCSQVRVAVSRSASMELANLKRLYKAHGFLEADIHAVIPSRVVRRRTPKPPSVPKPTAGSQISAPPAPAVTAPTVATPTVVSSAVTAPTVAAPAVTAPTVTAATGAAG